MLHLAGKPTLKEIVAFTVPAVILAAVLLTDRSSSTAAQATASIPAPTNWVPFSADMKVTHADGHEPTIGRFSRARDGSTRLETWSPSVPNLRIIGIKNIPQQTSYIRSLSGKWTSAPMQLPAEGWHPVKWRATRPGITKYPHKLDVEVGGTANLQAPSGLNAVRYVSDRGNISLVVPELNFFPVVTQILASGRRETFWNIDRDEPDPALFEPPTDVTVTRLEKPRGIISTRNAP